jgi:hypothetical protein
MACLSATTALGRCPGEAESRRAADTAREVSCRLHASGSGGGGGPSGSDNGGSSDPDGDGDSWGEGLPKIKEEKRQTSHAFTKSQTQTHPTTYRHCLKLISGRFSTRGVQKHHRDIKKADLVKGVLQGNRGESNVQRVFVLAFFLGRFLLVLLRFLVRGVQKYHTTPSTDRLISNLFYKKNPTKFQ